MRDMVVEIKKIFIKNDTRSEIWILDHNFIFAKTWVEPFLTDSSAKGIFDGVAWHDYEGSEDSLCYLSAKYPEMPMYHTEKSLYTTYGLMRILRIIRCGARSHNHWITISDQHGGPYQFGGGSEKIKEPLTDAGLHALYNLRETPDKWTETLGYYTFGHLSKFVKRGANRIGSDDTGSELTNAAFKNPDGSIVLVVSNSGKTDRTFIISAGGNNALVKLTAQSAATYVIK